MITIIYIRTKFDFHQISAIVTRESQNTYTNTNFGNYFVSAHLHSCAKPRKYRKNFKF